MLNDEQLCCERALLAGCARNEEAAWECLVKHYNPGLVSLFHVWLAKSPERTQAAEDLTQRVWSALWRKDLNRFDAARGPFAGFLLQLARTQLYRHFRGLRRERAHAVSLDGMRPRKTHATLDDEQLQIEDAASVLSPRQRELLEGVLLGGGKSLAELGFSRGNAEKTRQQMQERLRKKFFTFSEKDVGEGD